MTNAPKIWGRGLLLKSLPIYYSALILILESAVLSLLAYFQEKYLIAFWLIPALLFNPVVSKYISGDKNFTYKRGFYIYTYLNTPLTLALIISFIIKPHIIGNVIYVSSLTLVTYLLGLGIVGTFKIKFIRIVAITAVFYASYYVLIAINIRPITSMLIFLSILLMILVVYEAILKLNIGSTNGIELINSFALSWMDKASDAFDKLYEQLGEEAELKVALHEFVDTANNRLATVIIPYIHPGPAKAMGSGELPSIVYRELKKYNPLVLHGASDHSLNMASRSAMKDLMEKIINSVNLNTEPFTSLKEIKYSLEKVGKIRLTIYDLNQNMLAFVSKDGNTEDLPRQITEVVTKTLDIVDRHNTLCDEKTAHYSAAEVEILLEKKETLTKNAFEEIPIEDVGYSNYALERDDVGPGGITTLVLRGKKKIAIVSIDANNLVCGLDKVLEEKVKEKGYDLCEITTTDNHWNSGSTRAYPGYYLGGSLSKQELIQGILESLDEAERKARPVLYRKTFITFKTTVFGGKLAEMYRALNIGSKLIFAGAIIVAALSITLLFV